MTPITRENCTIPLVWESAYDRGFKWFREKDNRIPVNEHIEKHAATVWRAAFWRGVADAAATEAIT